MKIKLTKLNNDSIPSIYYLNTHCKMNNNSISEININYNSSFNQFVENQNQKTYFFADKLESSKETVICLLKRNKFVPKEFQKNVEGRFIVLNIKNN